jgi:hypothetical protein
MQLGHRRWPGPDRARGSGLSGAYKLIIEHEVISTARSQPVEPDIDRQEDFAHDRWTLILVTSERAVIPPAGPCDPQALRPRLTGRPEFGELWVKSSAECVGTAHPSARRIRAVMGVGAAHTRSRTISAIHRSGSSGCTSRRHLGRGYGRQGHARAYHRLSTCEWLASGTVLDRAEAR